VAAPVCTRHLGDLGARVIKVESRSGDFARDYDDTVLGMAAHFVWANRNKESIALDLKHPRGREVLARLVATAAVLVQNLAPRAAARLGLDAAELRARHPRLVTVDISGYGRGGPMHAARAYDLLVESAAGSCAITGWPDAPAKPGIPVADIGAGMYALTSVLAALLVRERTGQGTAISVGLFDAVAEWMGFALNQARYGGVDPQPNGLSSPMVAPYGAYRTGDGQVLVLGTTNDREWQRLAVGSGDHFCGGFDIVSRNAETGGRRPRAGSIQRRLPAQSHRLIPLLATVQTPVVCAVRGWAAGIGLHLVLAADFAVVAEDARLWEPFSERGFTPDSGGTWLLPRRIGEVRAREMLLQGRAIDGREAAAWGLAHRAVPAAEADAQAQGLASRLAAGPTVALGLTKWLLHTGSAAELDSHLRNEAFAMELSSRAEDFREGLAAFREKRPPRFSGR
jgi:enoyl-CoA hydratase/carnithine racemase